MSSETRPAASLISAIDSMATCAFCRPFAARPVASVVRLPTSLVVAAISSMVAVSVAVSPAMVEGVRVYRVRLGPIGSADEAHAVLSSVVVAGHQQAHIVTNY